MQQAYEVEEYVNGDTALIIHKFTSPMRNHFWVRSGVGLIEMDEQQLENLHELLHEYLNEERALEDPRVGTWAFVVAGAVIMTVLVVTILMIAGRM